MSILNRIEKIIQFLHSCIVWFQSDQINKFIEDIKLYKIRFQFFTSFSSIVLFIFISKIPIKIKSKLEHIPFTELKNNIIIKINTNTFQIHLNIIPAFQRNIVAGPFFFRTWFFILVLLRKEQFNNYFVIVFDKWLIILFIYNYLIIVMI